MRIFSIHRMHRAVASVLIPVCLATSIPRYLSAAPEVVSPAQSNASTASPLPASQTATQLVIAAGEDLPVKVKVNTTLPQVSAAPGPLRFTANPTDQDIALTRFFAEPLMPFAGKPLAGENAALAQGILALAYIDDFSALEAFLAKYPESRWNASLLTNLGISYRQHGYWTRALAAWETAWKKGKDETLLPRKLLVDRAVAQLGELKARLGRMAEVQALIAEVGDRDIRGSAAETWSGVKASFSLMQTQPTKSFRCGPMAVGKVLTALNLSTAEKNQAVYTSTCTDHGTSLIQVRDFAKQMGLDYQMAYRQAGAEVLYPAVIHWKAGHFAAITRMVEQKYITEDTTFTDNFVLGKAALDSEASGYFLVRAGDLPTGWRIVEAAEGEKVWGKGEVPPTTPPPPKPPTVKCEGMAVYNIDPSRVGLLLYDTPLFYTPPRGPAIEFTATYMQRDSAAALPNYPNLGSQWNFNWVSFIIDDPANINTGSYGPGGGNLKFSGYNSTTSSFNSQLLDQTVLKRTSPTSYEKLLPDGSRQVYGLADTSSPKRIFLTEAYDPMGNKITYTYDPLDFRLLSVTDAIGQVTTLAYVSNSKLLPDNVTANPDFYKVKTVTDPFGRSTSLEYNTSGQLSKITDMVGIVSQFTYSGGNFISKLTTPYGDSTFVLTEAGSDRKLIATDPQGASECVEFKNNMTAYDVSAPLPTAPGFAATKSYENNRTSYYWDKKAYAEGAGNYSKARLQHWLHVDNSAMADTLESEKMPLESRVYYNYPGQSNGSIYLGTSNRASKTARVLDDGSTQLSVTETNAQGKVTRMVTPGDGTTPTRTTTYTYATNGIDLLGVYQQNTAGLSLDSYGTAADLLASYTYDTGGKHLVLTAKDASRRTTTYTYNSFGQVLTVTNAKNETTTFVYDRDQDADGKTDGYLLTVTGPVAGATTTFQYDGFGRVWKVTDSENYTVTTTYDAIGGVATKTLNRPAKITYPDGTSEEMIYDKLDVQFVKDRLNRWTQNLHDKLRRVTGTIDPQGRLTQYDWCSCGSLEAIIDPVGNRTTWMRDVQSRVTQKIYPDNSVTNTVYETNTSRVKSVTDAKQQRTNYQYYIDNSLKQVSYTDTSGAALNPVTPTVGFTYDPVFQRVATMADGIGSTTYAYNPIPAAAASPLTTTDGAGRQLSVDGPFGNDTITYGYDQLGRSLNRKIDGANNATSYAYDTLGRMTGVTNPLGAFTYNYVNQTGRLQNVINPNGTRTVFDYFPNSGDQRLKQIRHEVTSGAALISQNDYTYAPTGRIETWTQNDSSLATTNAAQKYQFGYDQVDQLTSANLSNVNTSATVSDLAYGYDKAGNRTNTQDASTLTTYTANNLNQLTAASGGGKMRFAGTVNEPATVTVGGSPANVSANNKYEGYASVTAGVSNTIPIVATDKEGNVTSKTVTFTPATVPAQTFAYDANGNKTAKPGAIYEYDAANRLVKITIGANSTTFDYDGMSRRIREKLNGVEIKHLIWDGLEIAEERNASNTVTKRCYAQGFSRNAVPAATDLFYYTRDHLGSIREITGNTGIVRARYNYDPNGKRSANQITANPVESDFGYTGHYYYASLGLYAAPYRFYDPVLGRWLSRDPIGENGGINLYGYVANNPMNWADPLGLARDWYDRGIQLSKGVVGTAGGAALILGSAGPWAPLTVVSGAMSFQYGIANLVSAFAPDCPETNETAKKFEDMPSNLGGWLGLGVGGKMGQDVGSLVDTFGLGVLPGATFGGNMLLNPSTSPILDSQSMLLNIGTTIGDAQARPEWQ